MFLMRNAERTPHAIWEALQAGNRRFMNFEETRPNQDHRRRVELTAGQEPCAVVLACSDSRVPVEIIDLAVLGSLEYAVQGLHVPLIVVLGHESCGAVAATQAALDGHEIPGGFQRVLIEKVSPSILEARAMGKSTTEEFEAHHVAETVDQIMSRSPEIKAAVAKGRMGIVGVRYRLSDGLAEPVVEIGVEA